MATLQFYSTPWAGRRAFKAKQGKLLFNEGDFWHIHDSPIVECLSFSPLVHEACFFWQAALCFCHIDGVISEVPRTSKSIWYCRNQPFVRISNVWLLSRLVSTEPQPRSVFVYMQIKYSAPSWIIILVSFHEVIGSSAPGATFTGGVISMFTTSKAWKGVS